MKSMSYTDSHNADGSQVKLVNVLTGKCLAMDTSACFLDANVFAGGHSQRCLA